ncbi:glycosyltransferase family 2 protein [Eubacterium maltosivorans]|nr:glycosyltransferase family 2 protein [Eubacterium maltosivorans]
MISVIVPVYKVEKYLVRCLESILQQTYQDFEIILIDDGSPDNSGLICDKYVQKDKRIKVLHQKNSGLSDARNRGLEIASGEYIAFIDSDDWIDPYYFEILMSNLIKYDLDISICNFYKTTASEKISIDYAAAKIYRYSNKEALEQYFSEFYVPIVVAWGKIYKKHLFKNICFPKAKIHEDEFTTHRLILESDKIGFCDLPLYNYFQREDSIIGKGFNIKGKEDYLLALESRIKDYKNAGFLGLALKTMNLYCNSIENIFIYHYDDLNDNFIKTTLKKYRKMLLNLFFSKDTKNSTRIRLLIFLVNKRLYRLVIKKYKHEN